jgi:putative ABC transport system permease protein
MVPFRYNLRSTLVRKVTTAATALGIALVVFVFAAAQMLSEGVNRAMRSTGRTDTAIVLRKGSDAELSSGITNEQLALLRGQQGVRTGDGNGVIGEIVIVASLPLADDPSGISNIMIRGVPAEGMKFRPEVKIVSGRAPTPGTNEAIVGKAVSGRFVGVAPGKSFDLRRNRPLVIVGEFESGGSSYESEVWGDLDVIRQSLGRESVVSSARVRVDNFDAFRANVEADKSLSLMALREPAYYAKTAGPSAAFFSIIAWVVGILFSFAAMIGAAITMNGAVAHRTKEIGTLRALGFSRMAILTSFVLEAIFLALLGGILGTAISLLLGMVTVGTMNFMTFSELMITFHATPAILISALVFSVAMGLVGGLFPAIRASRVSPVEAMRA